MCLVYSTDTREHFSWEEPVHILLYVVLVGCAEDHSCNQRTGSQVFYHCSKPLSQGMGQTTTIMINYESVYTYLAEGHALVGVSPVVEGRSVQHDAHHVRHHQHHRPGHAGLGGEAHLRRNKRYAVSNIM